MSTTLVCSHTPGHGANVNQDAGTWAVAKTCTMNAPNRRVSVTYFWNDGGSLFGSNAAKVFVGAGQMCTNPDYRDSTDWFGSH